MQSLYSIEGNYKINTETFTQMYIAKEMI